MWNKVVSDTHDGSVFVQKSGKDILLSKVNKYQALHFEAKKIHTQ